MSQEIFYTSAPRGLKPGTRGFCTVMSTQGMSQPLAERLEALSGYRQLFAAHDPQARNNPIIYSHLVLTVGGRQHHVLSRIADAGLDYTQRSNKYAHHVALDTSELTPAGPAWTLSQPGFSETGWDGEPKLLAAGRRPPAGHSPAAICRHWQELTGDAGWGGMLAQTAAADPLRQAYILFQPGQDVLPLVTEAMALLPERRRWQVTFSTWFTKLPAGIDCQWRFVLADGPEAKAARRQQHALVIDLTSPLGTAASSPLVEAARTGILPAAARPQRAAPGVRPMLELDESEIPVAPAILPPGFGGEYGIGPRPAPKSRPFAPIGTAAPLRQSKKRLMWNAGIASVLLLIVCLAAWRIFIPRRNQPVASSGGNSQGAAPPNNRPADAGATTAPAPVLANTRQENIAVDATRTAFGGDQVARQGTESSAVTRGSTGSLDGIAGGSTHPVGANPGTGKRPYNGSINQPVVDDERLPPAGGPKSSDQTTNGDEGGSRSGEQAALEQRKLPDDQSAASVVIADDLADPAGCNLELLGWSAVAESSESPQLTGAPDGRTWILALSVKNSFGAPPQIARFFVEDNSLKFAWIRRTIDIRQHARLRDCVLKLTSNSKSTFYALREPIKIGAAAIDFRDVRRTISLGFSDQPTALKADALRLKLTIDGVYGAKVSKHDAEVDQHVEVSLPFEALASVRIEVGLKYEPGRKLALDIANVAAAAVWQEQPKSRSLSIADTIEVENGYRKQVAPLERMISNKEKELDKLENNDETPERNKEIGECNRAIDNYTRQIEFAEREAGNWERLRDFLRNTSGKLGFTIYYDVDGHKAVFAESLPEKESQPP